MDQQRLIRWVVRTLAVLCLLVASGVTWFYMHWPKGDPNPVNAQTPFVDDPAVLGEWMSVDFVERPEDFVPGQKRFTGALYLSGLIFQEGGKTDQPYRTWTKGRTYQHKDQAVANYRVGKIGGEEYLFLEWVSGDVILLKRKPNYYVLKRAEP